jgi:hypothetical protein
MRNLKKVGNRIDLPQLIQSETSKKSGVAEGAEETLQQQKIRAAISNGLAKSSQMGKTEYQSQPTNRTYFDNAGYASDKLTGIESIDPDGTVVISMGDTKAANWVKKLATLGGMPGVKTREVQPQKQGVTEGKGLAKKVKIVKGPDAGKTGWIREIKHGSFKGAAKSYYIDLDDGGQANNIPGTALRLVIDQDVAETAQGHTIEAHGVRGMDRKTWHKTFKNVDQLNVWAEKYDAEIHGTRDLEQAKRGNLSPAIRGVAEAGKPDVMRHRGDKTIRVVKKGGKPIGEIGIDAEASPGNGQYYVKLYDGSYDAVGFDTAAEALAELKLAISEGRLTEFAPSTGGGDDGDDGFDEDTLRQLAARWYQGDEDPRVEQVLMAAGWEIGQDEGYEDEPGVFVVMSGDEHGKTYISWPASELQSGIAEGASVVNIGAQVLYKGQPAEVIAVDGTAATVYVPTWKSIPGMVDDTIEVDPASKFLAQIGEQLVKEDDVNDFLARGGAITQVKPNKGPRYPGTSLGSKHIGTLRGGKASTISGKNANTRPTVKPVVAVEAERNEMDTPAVQNALAKMAAKHKDEKWSKEQLTALGKRLAARGAAERKTKGVDEDSWHDGQNAWSSENNQWSNESVDDRRLNRLIEYRLAEMRRAGYDI